MFKSGETVSEFVTQLDGSTVPSSQIQPHGVELTVDKVWRMRDFCVLGDEDYKKAPRSEAYLADKGKYIDKTSPLDHGQMALEEADKVEETDSHREKRKRSEVELDSPHYVLLKGPYVVRYNEKIKVPDKHVGFVLPRSRLIRNNNYLSTAVWDSGYEGRGEGGLHINTMTFLEKDIRIGQFLLCKAEVMHQYEGQHQKENLEE